MQRDEQQRPTLANPSFTVELEPLSTVEPVSMWFELVVDDIGWADLFLGPQNGSRPVSQTLRLSFSAVWPPLSDLATLAERAATYRDLPFSFEIDSEGPESKISLRPGPIEGTAVFEIRDVVFPALYFAAVVDSRSFGLALAHALRVTIDDPDHRDAWITWADTTPSEDNDPFNYFGNSWLRNVRIDEHPSKDWFYDGIDQANQQRYRG